jgi:hypothetical protein
MEFRYWTRAIAAVEPRYRLTNDVDERVRVIMTRKGVINWSMVTAHGAYENLVKVAKRAIQR